MNKTVQLLIVGCSIILSSCSNNTTDKIPETEMEKVSYSLGVNVATGVKAQGLDTIDANAVAKAFKDVFEGNELDISEEESMEVLQAYFGKLQEAAQKKAGAAGAQVTGGDDDVARLSRLEKASCEDEYKVALKKCTSH